MWIGEDRNKVYNIVAPNLPEFEKLYRPYMDSLVDMNCSGTMKKVLLYLTFQYNGCFSTFSICARSKHVPRLASFPGSTPQLFLHCIEKWVYTVREKLGSGAWERG